MTELYDVAAIGNAIVDVISPSSEDFLAEEGLVKGSMALIDDAQAVSLYGRMTAGIEASGGSAANTVAGVASLGGRAAYLGKVADDQLGQVFVHDINAIGVKFDVAPLAGGPATARCLINVTPDGQRTMSTYLGASIHLTPEDIDAAVIESAKIIYLEGYLFDPSDARRAFAKAAGIARASERLIALTLSDSFVVHRHREALLGFIDSEVDILLANEAELTALFETSSFDTAVRSLRGRAKLAAVTRGERGSTVIAGDQIHDIAAVPVEKVVDTTGAGDQYAAGFLFGLAKGRPLDMCGRLGSIAAAEVISHYGPRPQVSLQDLALKAGL
ncbi:MAG: carbohydrate kinase [Caulobacteraceae bacterium]|nr:carbohydrate kinase [Caulobacteraceae bacterium]